MAEQSVELNENLLQESVESTISTAIEKKITQKRRRGKRGSKKKEMKDAHPNPPMVANVSKMDKTEPIQSPFSRVIFDEDGRVHSSIPRLDYIKDSCCRKTRKRAGCFDMKRLLTLTKDHTSNKLSRWDAGFVAVGEEDGMSAVLPGCPNVCVRVKRDLVLEVRSYEFPSDYQSVVNYWYYNLDQLKRSAGSTEAPLETDSISPIHDESIEEEEEVEEEKEETVSETREESSDLNETIAVDPIIVDSASIETMSQPLEEDNT